MAGCGRTGPSADGQDADTAVDVPGWTNGKDTDSHQKRSNIICEITENQRLDQLRTVLGSGWDVNEVLHSGRWKYMPGLHQAAYHGWTEGVKMLLDAGAKCTTTGELNTLAAHHVADDPCPNLLSLALQNCDCPPALIELLLQYGADPNDHDDQYENIPLLNAIANYPECDPIIVQLLLQYGANPNVSYSVNVGGCGPDILVQCTALHDAAAEGWTEVLKMLFDAGAICITTKCLNPLAMAVRNYDCPAELIELLLKHGADPNDHDGEFQNIPLLVAIENLCEDDTIIIEVLLKHGADPNVTFTKYKQDGKAKWERQTALHEAGRTGWMEVVKMFLGADIVTPGVLNGTLALALRHHECQPELIELLLKQGADLNYTVVGEWPLIHQLSQYCSEAHHTFLQRSLDLFFLHGGNINMEDGLHKTALEHAVNFDRLSYSGASSNTIRWLIRHGADASCINFTWLKEYFIPFSIYEVSHSSPQIPLVLLRAGVRVSHGAHTQLSNIEVAISAWLQDDTGKERIIWRIQSMWDQLEKAEQEEPQRLQSNLKKSTLAEYWTQQMVDLQEFSDQSLHVYPEEAYPGYSQRSNTKQEYRKLLDQIQGVLGFLSQPLTLQWHCRFCVRENLVSLQPSVVKTLPLPARLKRYILCHEI